MVRNTKRKNEGITLIALVITIIVLLILAGVTIATLMGDNGILTKATEAKNDQADATIKEAIALLWNEYQLEIKSSNSEGVKESTKIASTEITKIQGEKINYRATTATSFWDFLLTEKMVIDGDGVIDVNKLTGQTLDRGNGTGVTDVYKIERNTETNAYTLKYCVKAGEEESIWNVTEINNDEEDDSVLKLTINGRREDLEDIIIEYNEGMTWREWIESDYNNDLLEIVLGYEEYGGDYVGMTDKIKNETGRDELRFSSEQADETTDYNILVDDIIDASLIYYYNYPDS